VPISDCEVRDPRMRRTRQLLQGALRNLMQTKRFDEISVQDITEAATVNRATFYDHYSDKYALLEAMAAGGFHRLMHERQVAYDGTCASAAGAIILAACDYLAESHPNEAACRQQSAFEPLIDSAITNAIRRVILEGVRRDPSGPAVSSEMIATATAWAIFGAAKEWSQTADRPPAEAIVPVILRLVVPILQESAPPAPLGVPAAAEAS
jgi:AcrR family transcriptional regulator